MSRDLQHKGVKNTKAWWNLHNW